MYFKHSRTGLAGKTESQVKASLHRLRGETDRETHRQATAAGACQLGSLVLGTWHTWHTPQYRPHFWVLPGFAQPPNCQPNHHQGQSPCAGVTLRYWIGCYLVRLGEIYTRWRAIDYSRDYFLDLYHSPVIDLHLAPSDWRKNSPQLPSSQIPTATLIGGFEIDTSFTEPWTAVDRCRAAALPVTQSASSQGTPHKSETAFEGAPKPPPMTSLSNRRIWGASHGSLRGIEAESNRKWHCICGFKKLLIFHQKVNGMSVVPKVERKKRKKG